MAKAKAKSGTQLIAQGRVAENRKARHDYEIVETIEAGLILTSSEVKSLRGGRASIGEAYAADRDGRLVLMNAHIAEYAPAAGWRGGSHDPTRPRELLLRKREIARLLGHINRDGMTLVPLQVYFTKRGFAKVALGLAKGRKQHDKREVIKKRDWERQKARREFGD
ncbi:MAG: SsrA-binding protein SmpB [Proteobacteria bacterium]|nr:SsrA-binding protein SmpB [Pseudomonadota bacterium]